MIRDKLVQYTPYRYFAYALAFIVFSVCLVFDLFGRLAEALEDWLEQDVIDEFERMVKFVRAAEAHFLTKPENSDKG